MALSLNQLSAATMDTEERHYFKAMGRRISQRRQELGLTQVELAATLNMPQQTYAAYEVGSRRIPVSLLPALGQALTMDLESLLGVTAAHTKRGPAPKFQQYVERISQLPKAQQRVVLQMLDGLLAQQSR